MFIFPVEEHYPFLNYFAYGLFLIYHFCMFFDSHVHFDGFEASGGLEAVMARAQAAGVKPMIAVGGSPETNKFAVETTNRFPDIVKAAIGYDRNQAGQLLSDLKSEIERLSEHGMTIAAIGEIGLDFYYSSDTAKNQVELFREQLLLARQLNLPVIIHSRKAEEATAELRTKNWGLHFSHFWAI